MKKFFYIILFLGSFATSFAGNADKEKTAAKVVAGKITDAYGESVPGAKVTITETGETFFADLEGNFKLTVRTDKVYSISINTLGFAPLVLTSAELTAFSDLSLKSL